MTVTVAQTTAGGEVAVWAGDGPQPPDGVAVSFDAGGAATNTTVVAYPADGKISVVSTADVFVFVSVSGYWLDATRQASYTYGPTGIRETRTTHEGTAIFGWDRSAGLAMLLGEQTPTGTIRYLYGPGGRPIAQADGAGNVVYLHTDQLGSVRAVTRSDTGAVIATRTYDAWGNPTQTTGDPTATSFGYAGEYTDAETGLVYLRARYYDPTTATFLTRDPAETLTRAPYGYTYGDPLNLVDPSGLWPWDGKCVRGVNCPIETQYLGESLGQSFREAHPEVAQGIVDFSSGVLSTNPITGTMDALGWIDTGQYANTCSGWYRGGQATMFAIDMWAAGGTQAARFRDSSTFGKTSTLFGRGGKTGGGLLNHTAVRVGWGWKGSATAGQDVFRIGFGNRRWHIEIWEVGNALRG